MSVIIENLTRNFGLQKALDDISFTINRNEIMALLGPNGAGKSTLMKIITCYLPQNHGEVKVCGHSVTTDSLKVRRIIGYLPENNPLYHDMYVREFLEFVAKIHKLGVESRKKVAKMIDQTGLEAEQHKKIGALSKGYRQRVGIAQAMIHNPEVLILDEPTSGLDPNQIVEIRNLIKEIGREKTVLLSTHIMQEVEAVCDRVVIINKGRIVADDPIHEIQLRSKSGRVVRVQFSEQPNIDQLKQISGVTDIVALSNSRLKIYTNSNTDIRPEIFKYAVDKGLIILEMGFEDQTIESVFRQLTSDK